MNKNHIVRLALAACSLLLALSTQAQITYVQLQPDGTQRLRQMNADGSGDVVIPVPFTQMSYPTWSRDGAVLAITASDASIPLHRSHNVFAISAANGAITKLTRFDDDLNDTQLTLNLTFPFHKAFSPDRAALATFSFKQFAAGGLVEFPSLEIHSITSLVNPMLLGNDTQDTTFHGGEGVDWAPNQNVLVTPLQASPPPGSGGSSGVTAIFFVEPSAGALNLGRRQQITFPGAGTAADFSFTWSQHDYQPKYSPNGLGLAYVRSLQVRAIADLSRPTPGAGSLRILDLTTGQDREVVSFQHGFYISSVNWSPDGRQLAFDIGVQAVNGTGQLLQRARPETNQIYIINVDGSGLQQLRGDGSSGPAFGPRINTAPLPQPTATPQPTAPPQPTATPAPSGALGNISTRLRVGSGDNALIGGFIITGDQPKRVLLRAIGPSLGAAGIQGALNDPSLELLQGESVVAANDNWRQLPNADEIPAGFAPTDDRESVIVTTVMPGSYTAVVRGVNDGTGIGLIEAYDLSGGGSTKLANISTRGAVEGGDNVLIGGFIADGATRVVIRAMGPSLGAQGVGNALQDPTLELYDVNGENVATNNDWSEAQEAELRLTTIQPGDNREAAIVRTLSPGAYTAIVRGNGGTTGVALVEVYHLP